MLSASPSLLEPSETPDSFAQKQESLAAAFEFFNETSQQLATSYRVLEKKVGQLTLELDQVSAEKDDEHHKKQQLAQRMAVLLDVLPGGVIVLDARGRIAEANPAAHRLLATALNGRLWREVIGECFAPRNDDGLEVSTRSGRRLSVATSSLDMSERSGTQGGGQIILLTDLTETRALQQQVSRTDKLSAMGKMVSALAHQIRTPLSAAILYADHLCHSSLTVEKRSDFSKKLFGRLQHMERQVRDMLLFVKSELPLNDVITVADLEKGLREAAEVAISSSGSQCHWSNTVGARTIKCNREALISALMNLVNNGIQAIDGGAILTLDFDVTTLTPEYVRISIQDNGPGMAEEVLSAGYEIFTTTKAQGTGLGLAVVQQVVKAHGGEFKLNSKKGRGVLANILIPFHAT